MMNEKSEHLLTILTPTYNRKKELLKLVESLNTQTNMRFQWLVIDDGSTDDTKKYIETIKYTNFHLDYYYKENGGKHTALNYAHPYIKGDYVCIVDSDDYLIPEAVELIYETIEKYDANSEIACISFQRGRDSNVPLVKDFPKEPIISNHIDFRLNEGRGGDCCEVERTNVFKEFPFPVFSGERFMSEGYLWVNMGMKYKTVYINKVIYICEYLESGLTKSGRRMRVKCPLGGMENSNTFLAVKGVHKLSIRIMIKEMLLYIMYGKFAGYNFEYIKSKCNRPGLCTLMYPLGIIMYMDWKRKYS